MRHRITAPYFIAAALTLMATGPRCNASLLGETVIYSYQCCGAPSSNGAGEALYLNVTTQTVGASSPLFNNLGSFNWADVSDTQISRTIDAGYSSTLFNGDAFYFPDITILGVSIASFGEAICGVRGITCGTFDGSRVTFDAHDVFINWQGGSWMSYAADGNTPTPLVLNVQSAPEPASLALGGLGCFGLFCWRWKNRRARRHSCGA